MGIFKTIRSAGAIGLIALAPCAALAQAWPTGPVRLFVGSPPGARRTSRRGCSPTNWAGWSSNP